VSPLGSTEPSTTTISVVVMGVSGSGKTTVARHLVDLLGWPFAEGDDFHPAANVEKMRSGRPLSDRDRKPWLAAVADWIGEQERAGRSAIVTCSALKRAYRDALRRDNPSVWFVHVSSTPDWLKRRLETRSGHYMPASLLASQLETLETLQPHEPGVTVSGEGPPDVVAGRVLDALRDERARRLRISGEPA
jgi:gluconokinase